MPERTQLEFLRFQLLEYFGKHIIIADLDSSNRIILLVNPFTELDAIIEDICINIFKFLKFHLYLELVIYAFGSNNPVIISLNK